MSKIIINMSERKSNYSQRNNENDPNNTCNDTNMIQCLDYCGWNVIRDDIAPQYKQPEDKLTWFMQNDKDILNFYKDYDPYDYNKWIKNPNDKTAYPPNEIHAVLDYGVKKYMKDETCTSFKMLEIKDIVYELANRRPVVVSVLFGKYNHIVSIVGETFLSEEDFENAKNNKAASPIEFIIDDTYGVYNFVYGKYDSVSGNDCYIPYNKMIECLKPVNGLKKIVHTFKINGENQ